MKFREAALGARLASALIALAVASGLALTGMGSAVAAPAETDAAEPTITWSVTPADADGPDGRSWMELEGDPGAKIQEHLAVRNLGTTEVTFALNAADGYFTAKGRFNMLPHGTESVDAGTWVGVQENVTVAPGGMAVVPVDITIPENATPGDHAAGLAASIFSTGSEGGASLGVESRVGFRVLTRVTGEIAPSLAVVSSEAAYRSSWNPFEPGSTRIEYTLENTGNARLSVSGSTVAGGVRVPDASGEAAAPVELLPGDRRTFQLDVPGAWPVGLLSYPLTVEQSVILPNEASEPAAALQQNIEVWAIPWSQLVVLLAVLLIVGGLLWGRMRRKRQVEKLLEEAREEGRRSVVIS
ncbi:hypothetical protein SAMN06295879_2994 [Agreia bicolorata]|uniref:DUF916 domain-containing protein n=1 Tax=Agreia bicolorata TaxID=110935 RepID=A0A1T4YF84_9MICO|nr:hypothetical protein [Agreia bicolorata]SKB00363.1 hypothetical protein SAMN06295879_2994 [Agreia bicolorata]